MKIDDVSLLNVKEYLRIEYEEDDQMLAGMMIAAKSFIQNYLNKKFVDYEDLPDEFTIAYLAIIGHWYGNRSIQSIGSTSNAQELKYMFAGLLDPHRLW